MWMLKISPGATDAVNDEIYDDSMWSKPDCVLLPIRTNETKNETNAL